MIQHDIQREIRAVPPESISPSERVARMREHFLRRSVGSVLPAATHFLEAAKSGNVEDIQQKFIAATLATHQALEVCASGGLLSKQTVSAASTMFEELRKQAAVHVVQLQGETMRSLDTLDTGVRQGQKLHETSEHIQQFFQTAQGRIEWLRKMAEQTMRMKRPDLLAQPQAKRENKAAPSLH